jgi:prevent-host-death family protein
MIKHRSSITLFSKAVCSLLAAMLMRLFKFNTKKEVERFIKFYLPSEERLKELYAAESATVARETISELVGRVYHAKERILIMRHNKPVAVLGPVELLQFAELMEKVADKVSLENPALREKYLKNDRKN